MVVTSSQQYSGITTDTHSHTHLSTFYFHLHISLQVDTLIIVKPLNPFHFQTPNPKHVTPILLFMVLH